MKRGKHCLLKVSILQKISRHSFHYFFYTEVVLYPDDMSWIMPLLRRAAPKWKLILTEIGMPNDQIMSLMKRRKDGVVLLEMGVSKWLREHTPPGATLADLVKALCGVEVGEEEVASEILKGKSIRYSKFLL